MFFGVAKYQYYDDVRLRFDNSNLLTGQKFASRLILSLENMMTFVSRIRVSLVEM